MPDFSIKICKFTDAVSDIKSVRETVFVEEQHVPVELEWDGLDEGAVHAIAVEQSGQQVIATGRLLHDGHIGRMAVLKGWRGQGIGRAILTTLTQAARQAGHERVFLHAQTSAVGFYEKQAFTARGEIFMDAGIPHQRMVCELK